MVGVKWRHRTSCLCRSASAGEAALRCQQRWQADLPLRHLAAQAAPTGRGCGHPAQGAVIPWRSICAALTGPPRACLQMHCIKQQRSPMILLDDHCTSVSICAGVCADACCACA